jgi:hypothetical protein
MAISHSNNKAGKKNRKSSSLLSVTDEELIDVITRRLEAIRKEAMHEIEETSSGRGNDDAWKAIDAGYTILNSYGFEGNELKKAWRGFSFGHDFHKF